MEPVTFIRGRKSGSTNLLLDGFRYSKDGKETEDEDRHGDV